MRSVELFVGAGGLAMGVAKAGFKPAAVVEWNRDACETIRENQRNGFGPVADWPLFEGDVRQVDFKSVPGTIDLVTGGPPCQPFSICGKHQGYNDSRDMFPEAVRAVRELRPRAFILENVRGLTRPMFREYFAYIQRQLTFPEQPRAEGESWIEHAERLARHERGGHSAGLTYRVVAKVLNAADFGVPQKRERVFIVGFRSDLDAEWSPPTPTHSFDALVNAQWVAGEYWERHGVSPKHRPAPPDGLDGRLRRLKLDRIGSTAEKPWITVREALRDLPDPREDAADRISNHRFQPGARAYKGHTGSPLDGPAKTLKAGDHGVPGGENMLVTPCGETRYFTVRESARLQAFPDNFVFRGSWSEAMRQLGNAVPVTLGYVVAESVAAQLWVARHGIKVA